jgi:hypothetical protein
MKRYLASACGVAMILLLAIGLQPLKAQVWGDFNPHIALIQNAPYVDIDPLGSVVISPTQFDNPFTLANDKDDGYYYLTFPDTNFSYEFNGNVWHGVWICINGFITFQMPPAYPARDPNRLFAQTNDKPWDVIAPFWGDHYLRIQQDVINGFTQGEISWLYNLNDNNAGDTSITIQWHNLNVNCFPVDSNGIRTGKVNNSSYADFQVKLYKSKIPNTQQGVIQFCYGVITGSNVVTSGASVGLRGEAGDFMNGLIYDGNTWGQNGSSIDYRQAEISNLLTSSYQPSRGTSNRIEFDPIPRFYVENPNDPYQSWGDGDADLSQGVGQKHQGLSQNRYVTINDVLVIMRSVSTGIPLDPVRYRPAYHADVNHNGRYYYDSTGQKHTIPWKDSLYTQNISVNAVDPITGLDSIWANALPSEVRFEANEYDAALILDYIAGRLTGLPWLIDSIVSNGKVNAVENATSIKFGNVITLGNGLYQVPVYLNGYLSGPLGVKFDINGKTVSIENLANADQNLQIMNGNNTVVMVGSGVFNNTMPILNLTFSASTNELQVNNVRFNDKDCGQISLALTGVEETTDYQLMLQNSPNPFFGTTLISINIPEAGNYTLTVYDLSGNKVKTLVNSSLNPGSYNYNWDATDEAGATVGNGMYIYRLVGDAISVSKKMIIAR